MVRYGTTWRKLGIRCGITARLNYLSADAAPGAVLRSRPGSCRYALGRDHRCSARRNAQRIRGSRIYRSHRHALKPRWRAANWDSAGAASIAAVDPRPGSWFLGEIYTDLPLLTTAAAGTAAAAPHDARPIVAPYELDARRCISYLTIELAGSIPEDLRPLIGNRIYGCDDCQLACPWNRFAAMATEPGFAVRHGLDAADLVALFAWTEAEFGRRMEGSAIRRIGFARWSRNIAVAMGNAPCDPHRRRWRRARSVAGGARARRLALRGSRRRAEKVNAMTDSQRSRSHRFVGGQRISSHKIRRSGRRISWFTDTMASPPAPAYQTIAPMATIVGCNSAANQVRRRSASRPARPPRSSIGASCRRPPLATRW
jgi:epoxyqueuosine reductase